MLFQPYLIWDDEFICVQDGNILIGIHCPIETVILGNLLLPEMGLGPLCNVEVLMSGKVWLVS